MRDDVLHFISRFAGSEHTFLNGCCYWFAYILHIRFGGKIAYEPIEGHFITEIDNLLYDVRGDITDSYKDKSLLDWERYKDEDPLHVEHVERDCVRMERY